MFSQIFQRRAAIGPLLRSFLAFGLAIVLISPFLEGLRSLDWQAIRAGLLGFSVLTWIRAGLCVALSFLAIAVYDIFALRAMRLSLGQKRALLSGFSATATAQFVGFGLVSGTLVRWFVLGGPDFSLSRAAKLTLFVSAGFCGLCLFWGGVFQLLLHLGTFGWIALPPLLTIVLLGFAWLGCRIWILGIELILPPIRLLSGFAILCLVDLFFSAMAFWLFLPAGSVGFWTFLAGFPLALLAGLMSAIPGGAGAMDLVLLSVFPQISGEEVMKAMMAYRLVAIAMPGLLAFALLLRLRFSARDFAKAPPVRETGARSPDHCLLQLAGPSPHSGFADLALEAEEKGLIPALYGVSAGDAVSARERGAFLLPVGAEALLLPDDFTTEGKPMAGLRRKLRLAERAGICVETSPAIPDAWREMESIAAEWQARKGSERGYTMSRFSRAALKNAPLFVARHHGKIVGFISFQEGYAGWRLDLVRLSPTAPDGTAYALVLAAIEGARNAGVKRFSLAAVPFFVPNRPGSLGEYLCQLVYSNCNSIHRAQGLLQFKSTFRPVWEQRYLVARNPAEASIAAIEVLRKVVKSTAGG